MPHLDSPVIHLCLFMLKKKRCFLFKLSKDEYIYSRNKTVEKNLFIFVINILGLLLISFSGGASLKSGGHSDLLKIY